MRREAAGSGVGLAPAEYGLRPAEEVLDEIEHGDRYGFVVIVPYGANVDWVDMSRADRVPPGGIRPSAYSELTRAATQVLAVEYSDDVKRILPIGEHTFGLEHTSTTELMFNRFPSDMRDNLVEPTHIDQRGLNSTVHQMEWLARYLDQDETGMSDKTTLLVAMELHAPRIHNIAKRLGLRDFVIVDGFEILERLAEDAADDFAVQNVMFNEENRRYENTAAKTDRILGPLGPFVVKTAVLLRTPNIVDALPEGDGSYTFFGGPARTRIKQLIEAQQITSPEA